MLTIIAAVTNDHRELESQYKEILRAPDNDVKERWRNMFIWELARHFIGEGSVKGTCCLPRFEKYLRKKGKAMADKDRAEHAEVTNTYSTLIYQYLPLLFQTTHNYPHLKRILAIFQNLPATSPDFQPFLEYLYTTLKAHMAEKEISDLPTLEAVLNSPEVRQQSANMAKSFEKTKMFVLSRSHPGAPDKPPFETVAGLLAAPIDRLADLFRKFPKEESRVSPDPLVPRKSRENLGVFEEI
ncbi:hypothetical protein RUND412_005922 [Rhizina undulata]